MTSTNIPEKPFYEDIVALEEEILNKRDEIKQLYADAKSVEAIGADGVKTLRLAVRRALETQDKKEAREAREDAARALLDRFMTTPLGRATA